MTDSPHSDFILNDVRDDWWNNDFVSLMAQRLDLSHVRRVLDVGCGHGHWGHLWARHFAQDATLLGVDREAEWVAKATSRAAELGLASRFQYTQGDALTLPVPDGTFDLVTCQTVLMHVSDPEQALAEMIRALAPGGLLLLAEPCNAAALLVFDSPKRQASIDDTLQLIRFHLICNQGRMALGEGDHSIGTRVPELVAQTTLSDIQVHLNDKSTPMFASRARNPTQQRILESTVKNIEARVWLWQREEAERLYLAGGGTPAQFDQDYGVFMADSQAFVDAVNDGTYSTVGGSQHYLISARKPTD